MMKELCQMLEREGNIKTLGDKFQIVDTVDSYVY